MTPTVVTKTTNGPLGLELKIQNALSGVQQTLPAGSALPISGVAVTQAQLIQALQGFLPPFQAVHDTKAKFTAAVLARTQMEPAAKEYIAQLRAALIAFFGRGSPMLAQFGMSAKVASKQTSQTAILGAAKRAVTRQKRGTLTPTQKAGIKAIGTPAVELGASGVKVTASAADAPTAPIQNQPAAAPAASTPAVVPPAALPPQPPAK